MTMAEEIQKLEELRSSGSITNEEFARMKADLISGGSAAPGQAGSDPAKIEQDTRQWGLFLHLSLLAGFVVPLAGLVAPIIIWQVKKADLPIIDEHGKVVVNWIISAVIYSIVSAILIFVVIGIFLLIALGILSIVFPIIGGLKANQGIVWKYPLSIAFIK